MWCVHPQWNNDHFWCLFEFLHQGKLWPMPFKKIEIIIFTENNLETILAIGTVELIIPRSNIGAIPRSNIIIDCSQYNNPIIPNNPTEIIMSPAFNFKFFEENKDKFAANFGKFCSFLIRACPALNNLHITFWNLSIYQFTHNLYTIIMAMEAGIKSIDLQISIQLRLNFAPDVYDNLPFGNHDLFKLGTPFIIEGIPDYANEYIARSMEFVDVRGRTHKLLFKIIPGMIAY